MKIKNIIISCVGLCFMSMTHAYIYQAVVMKKWHADLQRYHYFIGLGDFHNKKDPANAVHLAQLKGLFDRVDKHTFKLFTEDLSDANIDGRFGCQHFAVNSRGGVLGGLTQLARFHGIDADNLEYRYARVCALAPVLNNMHKAPSSFQSTSQISVGHLLDEIAQEADAALLHEDGRMLSSFYQSQIKCVEDKIDALRWPACSDMSVAEYLAQSGDVNISHINHLLTFDAKLFDVKLVHEVMQHQDKERVCAIAGGSHIDRASKALQKVGYTSVFKTKPVFQRATAIDAGGVMTERKKPQAISLETVRKFF